MGNVLPWGYKSAARSLIQENDQKRKGRFDEAKKRCSDLEDSVRDEILQLSFFQLRDALQSDKYNATTVLKAYTWKALLIQDEINCLAEYLTEAFEKADILDQKYSGKEKKPPLYGLPFSVKANFFIKDYDCCIGLSKFLNDAKDKDCTIVTFLHELGAIPFVLTNVPQALLSFVCSNSVYGTTSNPHKHDRVPGGSSGGEAALLAAGGSVFGTGSDLAGSLRIPASACGVVALKPTEARISLRNCVGGIPGKGRMGLGIGFFTHTVDEHIFILELALKAQIFHVTTPKHVPLPLNNSLLDETLKKKSLKIGYFLDDGFLKPTPGCSRVVSETVEKLKLMGHELVVFNLPKPYEAADLCYKSIMTDGGTYLSRLYAHDLVDQYLSSFVTLINLPIFIRYLGSFVVGHFSPQAKVLARAYVKTIEELRLNYEGVDTYTEEVFDLINEQKLDAIICPAFTAPAMPHKYPSLLGACGFATAIWNMLDWPAGVVPVDNWTDQDEADLMNEKTWPVGNNFVLKLLRDASSNSKGLPLGVQVVARPYQEEVCLAVMKVVENAWK